jgi:hypothetical protein
VGRTLAALIRDAAESHQGAEKYLSRITQALELLAQARAELNGLSYIGSKHVTGAK